MAGTVEAPAGAGENFDSTELVAQAKADSLAFFGVEKPVSPVPLLLPSVLLRLREMNLEAEAVYLPQATLGESDSYPGWKSKIGQQYYDWLKAGQVSKASPQLPGRWVVIETFRRPEYAVIKELKEGNGGAVKTYRPESDQMGEIIIEGRFDGKIAIKGRSGELIVPYLPQDSRFAVSLNQQDDYVFPELDKAIGIDGLVLRRPALAELNYLGNLNRFNHLGQATTLEAVQDVYLGIVDRNAVGGKQVVSFPERAIITGSSTREGLSGVDYMLASDQVDAVTFRALIELK